MKKYPYIGEWKEHGLVVLFTGAGEGYGMKDLYGFDEGFSEGEYTNITREYLQNTCGVVESKEHAEFIARMALNEGILFTTGLNENYPCWFAFDEELYFFKSKEYASDSNRKQITIPLQPKSKEWSPEVGDEVVAVHPCNKLEGKLLALTNKYAIISQGLEEQHLHLSSWSFEKPKTAQELKIEELQTKLCENNAVDNYILACDIVMGNIEGLSYE